MPTKTIFHCGACNHRLHDPASDHCPYCRADLHAVGRCREAECKHLNQAIVVGGIVVGAVACVVLIWLAFR